MLYDFEVLPAGPEVVSGSMGGLPAFLTQIVSLVQGAAGGGFPALLAQFENAGLGERIRSWMGHGDNLPVTEAELEQVFSPEQLNSWAEHVGASPDAMLTILARDLPGAVHQTHKPSAAPS
jgi:uncharacterized protein YidB (DUF937 family)